MPRTSDDPNGNNVAIKVRPKRKQLGEPGSEGSSKPKKPRVQPTKEKPKRKTFDNISKIDSGIIDRFKEARDWAKNFKPKFDAGKAQSALTRLNLPGKDPVEAQTTNNMHAELVVLGDALQPTMGEKGKRSSPLLAITMDGNIVVNGTGSALKKNQFKTVNPKTAGTNKETTMDHCGYCTYFLTLMEVPTGTATFQTSVMAGAQVRGSAVHRSPYSPLPYPLPERILKHPAIIAKALGFKDANHFVNEVREGIEAYYASGEGENESETSKSPASKSEGRRRSDRATNLSPMEKLVSDHLQYEDFEDWRNGDNKILKELGSGDLNEGAEERFNSLLEKFFGSQKGGFLNSLWNPVIDRLTHIMGDKARLNRLDEE